MNYIELDFRIDPLVPVRDILTAELGELGFDSFVDTDFGVKAYIEEGLFVEEALGELISMNNTSWKVSFNMEIIEKQNWNAAWESNFEPIEVNEKCRIIAPFHNLSQKKELEIIISPQMSFGTGHHETTFLISRELFNEDLDNKTVLDMGAGTGVLAIICSKLGALEAEAIDIEEWAYENCKENVQLNDVENVQVIKGDSTQILGKKFDLIIANINKNVLLMDMETYSNALSSGGRLMLSGFYDTDKKDLENRANENELVLKNEHYKNNWGLLIFEKR